MIKRILVTVSLLLSLSFGAGENIDHKKIQSRTDFAEFEKVLKEAIALEPGKSYYYLGLLYSSQFTLANGEKISPDYEKALPYFQKSYETGKKMAAFNISMILSSQGKVEEAMFMLDQSINGINTNAEKEEISTGAYLSVALASLIMDVKAGDEDAIALGIKHLEKYVQISNIPTGDYILSRMYLQQGKLDSANRFLTRACKNPAAPQEIRNICSSFKQR